MLNLITLEVLKKIFEEHNLQATFTQAIYFKCLIYQFSNKEQNIDGISLPFRLSKVEVNFKLKSVEDCFIKLEEASLVEIEQKEILFKDVWSKYLRKDLAPTSMVGIKDIDFEKEILTDGFYELIKRRYGVSDKEANLHAKTFIKEQEYTNKVYNDINDCKRHFTFWIGKNYDAKNYKGKVSAEVKQKETKLLK